MYSYVIPFFQDELLESNTYPLFLLWYKENTIYFLSMLQIGML